MKKQQKQVKRRGEYESNDVYIRRKGGEKLSKEKNIQK